jgi:hypothetical protein
VENSESKLKRKLETPVRANNFTSSDGRSNPKEKSQRIIRWNIKKTGNTIIVNSKNLIKSPDMNFY